MPLIQVQVIKDVFTKEQKRQIISKLTDAMVFVEGENMPQVTLCLVECPSPGSRKGCVTARPRVAPCCARAIDGGPGALRVGSRSLTDPISRNKD
jgi:4-oxalocrotonate tautomerase family enzyme